MTLMLSVGTSSATSPTTAQFQPLQVALASAGGEVFVLGYKICTVRSCSGPELWAGTGDLFVQRAAPPGTMSRYLSQLVFANALDGYEFNPVSGVYATTNGGASWTVAPFAPDTYVPSLVASDGWFYAVTEHCVTSKEAMICDDYRLERSLAGSVAWSSVPIPYTSELSGSGYMGVTAWGREVTVSVRGPGEGETLLRSDGGLAPLRVAGRSDWSSTNGACELAATSYLSIWEMCSIRNGSATRRLGARSVVTPLLPPPMSMARKVGSRTAGGRQQ